jgi:hypothetical protein
MSQSYTDPKHQILAQCAAKDRKDEPTTPMLEAFRKAALAVQQSSK